jgi:hypothetical protein
MLDISKVFPQFYVGMNGKEVTPHQYELKLDEVNQKPKSATLEEILENLSERQKMVFTHLKKHWSDGATAKELSLSLYGEDKVISPERNSVHPRLNEMVKMGLVEVVGKKTCRYTDRKVTIYKSKK